MNLPRPQGRPFAAYSGDRPIRQVNRRIPRQIATLPVSPTGFHRLFQTGRRARGYFVSTVGRDEEMIRAYIKTQELADKQLDQMQLKLASS
jgi:REP element-mobilizing transposase RayT